jgi:hypothetical protein
MGTATEQIKSNVLLQTPKRENEEGSKVETNRRQKSKSSVCRRYPAAQAAARNWNLPTIRKETKCDRRRGPNVESR